MLSEKLLNPTKSPIYIELLKINEYPFHTHDEMEIIYLLKGKLKIDVSVYEIELTESNSFVVNVDTMHYLRGLTGDDIALIIHIDINQFTEYYPSIEQCIFICNSEEPGDNYKIHKEFQELLLNLTKAYYSDNKNKSSEIQNLCIAILLILVNYFQNWHLEKRDISSTNIYKDRIFQIQRLRRIVAYIYGHFPEKITLGDIADMEHVSKYHLSHLISTGLGTSFQDFLNGVRTEKSLEYLYGTKLSIEDVAEKCGFSSVNFYRKNILEKIGDKPYTLRKKHHDKTIVTMIPDIYKYDDNETENIFKTFMKSQDQTIGKSEKEVSHISVDLSSNPSKLIIEFVPHINLTQKEDIWKYNIFEHIKYLTSMMTDGNGYVSVNFDILSYYKERNGDWNFINRFAHDLKKINVIFEIMADEKKPDLDELVDHLDSIGIKDVRVALLNDEELVICSTPTEIISAVINGNQHIHMTLGSLLSDEGLKRPAIYAADFARRLQGSIIGTGKDHLFTFSDSAYKLITMNDKKLIKDFIINLTNINQPMICRIFKMGAETGNETAMWEGKKISRELTPDIKWSIENVCAPKTELMFMESMAEQDLYIPLEKDEIALVVLDV